MKRYFTQQTLLKKSLIVRLLLVLMAFVLMVTSSCFIMFRTLNAKNLSNTNELINVTASFVSQILNEPKIVLNFIANNIEEMYIRGESLDTIRAYMTECSTLSFRENISVLNYNSVYGYFFNTSEFHDGAGWQPSEEYNPRTRPWFSAALAADGQVAITSPYIATDTQVLEIAYARLIFDGAGNPAGIICINYQIAHLSDLVVNKRVTPNGYGFMLDENLRVIIHPNDAIQGEALSEGNPNMSQFYGVISGGSDILLHKVQNYSGVQSFMFGRQIDNGWHLMIVVPEHEFYKELYEMVIIISVLGAVLAGALIIILLRLEAAKQKSDNAHQEQSMQLATLEMLRDADERLQLILDASPFIITLWNEKLQPIMASEESTAMFLLPSKQDYLDRFYELSPEIQPDGESSSEKSRRLVKKAFEEGYYRVEWMHKLLDGEPIPCEITLVRVKYRDEYVVAGYTRDLRELKALLTELEDALENATAADRAKSSFLATMSHEIRTPMNAILGITEIYLQNDALEQSVRDGLEKIYMSGDMLLGIINDILDLSKIEAGKLEIITANYEVASLISDTVQINMMRIGSKPIEFELHVDENLPTHLIGDELRVKQILNNLLSNGFKYTEAGTVTLSVAVEAGDTDGEIMLAVSVSDTGQGMNKEQVDRLFDEYSRFNIETNRTTEGTGLGLSITRNLIHMMKGTISVKSEPNKGSVFTMHLPQGKAGSEVLGKEMADNLHNFRTSSRAQMKRVQITRDPMPYGKVLIVDDVETNIFVARGLMKPYELNIDSADSGFDAIEKIKTGNIYDIVFMDHMMPDMDGVEATKIIREMGYKEPIVALTANAVAGQAEIFLGNGFDDFISKPIDIRRLNVVLNKLIRDKQTPEVIEAARKQSKVDTGQTDGITLQPLDSPQVVESFLRDAEKSLAALNSIIEKGIPFNEESMRNYIIHTHGMKSALANVGKMDLSAIAFKLERMGRDNNIEVISTETPAFINSLRAFVDGLTFQEEVSDDNKTEIDFSYVNEKLIVIKAACEEYDEDTAANALTELRKLSLPQNIKKLLGTISEQLLHSGFEEIADAVDKYIENR